MTSRTMKGVGAITASALGALVVFGLTMSWRAAVIGFVTGTMAGAVLFSYD